MNILFLFLRHAENSNHSTLTKDLSDEFFKQGNNVTVVTLLEKKYNRETQLKIENGYEVLRVKTGNYFDLKSKIEKGITVLTMPRDIKREVIKNLGDKKYDLIIAHTPFVSSESIVKPLKEYFKCPAFLILWDIFPQNGKDIGLINNSILFNFFKWKEKKMLSVYDKILCMSEGNMEYMKNNYPYLKKESIKLLRNWAIIKPKEIVNKQEIREKYGYEKDEFIAIFGGNMGKPQKLENILSLAEKVLDYDDVKFLFIGSGTEKDRLERYSKDKKLKNVKFLNQVPREDYEKLTAACDVGIVSLDERFTVPNFPSKTTDYFKLSLPILASLDSCAAEDYGVFLAEKVKGGLFAQAGNIEELYEKFMILYTNENLRKEFGENGREYYEENLGVDKAYITIMDEIKDLKEIE